MPDIHTESLELKKEWEDLLGHPLTADEYHEIRETVTAFFGLLNDWADSEREEQQVRSQSDSDIPEHAA